jgi:alkanesulfonate monooxygenase SsuD/methylene tetrahydromethanopterin reductase-like flavin-dependent oxidoreductase (luciferase family)
LSQRPAKDRPALGDPRPFHFATDETTHAPVDSAEVNARIAGAGAAHRLIDTPEERNVRQVKFGYWADFRNPEDSGRSFIDLYRETFRQIERAEELGFNTIWFTEHHFTDDGYLPALMPMAAAVAARTSRIKVGTYVLLAPFYHPLKLAEESAVVDLVSNGRLRLGLGQGYALEEFAGFGVKRSERLGRTLETVEILKRAWTGERFSYQGKYHNCAGVRVLPRPVSQPHPELLWGAAAKKAIVRGAELGMSFATTGDGRSVALYKDALKERGQDPAQFSFVCNQTVYVADSAEDAWADIERPLMYQAELYSRWISRAQGIDPSQSFIRPDPERLRRVSVIGTPAQVRERLRALLQKYEFTELIVVTQLPGLDPAKACRSLERFGTEVMPFVAEV